MHAMKLSGKIRGKDICARIKEKEFRLDKSPLAMVDTSGCQQKKPTARC
jgi:hypothetical protein